MPQVPSTGDEPSGPAMRTVRAALDAISAGRFGDLEPLVAADIDWRALPDEAGETPGCHNRHQALKRIQIGMLASKAVTVKALSEHGPRVLAHVEPASSDAEDAPLPRYLVIDVRDGQIERMTAYGTEVEAQAALHDNA